MAEVTVTNDGFRLVNAPVPVGVEPTREQYRNAEDFLLAWRAWRDEWYNAWVLAGCPLAQLEKIKAVAGSYVGRHRRVDPDEPLLPWRNKRPSERLSDEEALAALEWLLVSCGPDVESLSVDYGNSAYNVKPRAYLRTER